MLTEVSCGQKEKAVPTTEKAVREIVTKLVWLKERSPMTRTARPNSTVVRLTHLSNAEGKMIVTELPIVTAVTVLAASNAFSLMAVTWFPMTKWDVSAASDPASEKAYGPMYVSALAAVRFTGSLRHLEKA